MGFKTVNFDNIARGKLKHLVDNYLSATIQESIAQAKLGTVPLDELKAKINIEIAITAMDEFHYAIDCKVKKTLPSVTCESIAIEEDCNLMFREEGGDMESPLQTTIEQEIENQINENKKAQRKAEVSVERKTRPEKSDIEVEQKPLRRVKKEETVSPRAEKIEDPFDDLDS